MTLRILGAEREIIVDAAARPAGRIAHQRAAVLPAAEHLAATQCGVMAASPVSPAACVAARLQ
ncbi:hypothetical protein ACVOMV_36680 [Mesorhizobium atlanticum]